MILQSFSATVFVLLTSTAPAPLASSGANLTGPSVPASATSDPSPAMASPSTAPTPAPFAAPLDPHAAVAAQAPAPSPQQPPPAPESPPLGATTPLPADPEALTRLYRRTGTASSVEQATESLFPYGHGRPVLRCAPLRACAVQLEAGEIVLATALGDTERWLLQAAFTGNGARTPILVVKPTACDLSTNLLVSTDRRLYEIALDSPPCRGADSGEAGYNPRLHYSGLTRFYYPDELVRRWRDQEDAAREQAALDVQDRTPLNPDIRLSQLNFDYTWEHGRWPWAPSQIYDDGQHTYLLFPPAARLADLPLLFGLGPQGELALLNTHLDGRTLIVDRVLDRAALVVGNPRPRDHQRLEIVNRAYPRHAPAAH